MGTMTDVTDRKRAEEALRRSEAYLADAQRLTHTGSWAYKAGGVALIGLRKISGSGDLIHSRASPT